MTRIRTKSWLLIGLPLLAILAAGATWQFGGHAVPDGQPPLVTLDASTLADLKTDFNASTDAVRVIVLLSPT